MVGQKGTGSGKCPWLSFLLAEGTVEAAVLLPLPQLREQRPAGGAQPAAGLRARRWLSVGAHVAARRLLGDVLVDLHVGDVRSEAFQIPPFARRRREPLKRLRPPLRPRALGLRVAAGRTPVSDRSLLEKEGLPRPAPGRSFDAADG